MEKAELANYELTRKTSEDGIKLKSRLARLLRGPLALQRAPRVADIRYNYFRYELRTRKLNSISQKWENNATTMF